MILFFSGRALDLGRAPYVLYGGKYIDPVSPAPFFFAGYEGEGMDVW